jgi:hypothetical protein
MIDQSESGSNNPHHILWYYGNSKPLGLIIMIDQSETASNNPHHIIFSGSCQAFPSLLQAESVKKLCKNVVPQPLC